MINNIEVIRAKIMEISKSVQDAELLIADLAKTDWQSCFDQYQADKKAHEDNMRKFYLERMGKLPTCDLCKTACLPSNLAPSVWDFQYPGKYCRPCNDIIAQEFYQSPEPCQRCGQLYPRYTLKSVDMPGYHHNHCSSCVDTVIAEYTRACCLCGKVYILGRSGTSGIADLCNDCATPKHKRESQRVCSHNSRARALGLPATLTFKEWVDTLDYFNWECAYCPNGEFTDLEHFVPLGEGSGTAANNCIPACGSCNAKKNNRHPDQLDSIFLAENLARIRQYLSEQSA